MKEGTHIWYKEQVWIVDYYCDRTCRMDITSCLQQFGTTIPDIYFKLPINDPNHAKSYGHHETICRKFDIEENCE